MSEQQIAIVGQATVTGHQVQADSWEARALAAEARAADLERSYASAVAMCVRWKEQRDRLRVACGYSADQIRDCVQPEDGTFYAAIVADLDAAMKATRDFADPDYVPSEHAEEVTAAHPARAALNPAVQGETV